MHMRLEFNVERRLGNPKLRVMIDENLSTFDDDCPDVLDVEFGVSPGEHDLRITHYNKHFTDHAYENGQVTIDKHFELKEVYLDEIPLKEILWRGDFFPVYDQHYLQDNPDAPRSIRPNLYFGHNGTWQLTFRYPIADWIMSERQQVLSGNKAWHPDWLTNEEEYLKVKAFFESESGLDWDNIV